MYSEPLNTVLGPFTFKEGLGHGCYGHSDELACHFALTVEEQLSVFIGVIKKIVRVDLTKNEHITCHYMIVLPLKLHFSEISCVPKLAQGCISHIFPLPDPEKSTIFLVCVQLHPIIPLVPRHAHLLKIVEKVY